MAKKKTEEAANTAETNVVKGEVAGEMKQTVVEQAKAARGDEEAAKDDGGSAGASAHAKGDFYTDEQKFKDAAKEARVEHLESIGITNSENASAAPAPYKVEDAGSGDKMYQGVVTVTGVDGQYHKKISTRIDVGPTPKGQGWLLYAFGVHFPSADLSKGIEVDEKNEADPLLRTQHG